MSDIEIIDLEYYEGLLREIGEIVRTPTKATRHRTAQDHYQADFDAIRKIVATGLTRPVGNSQEPASKVSQADQKT
jgi:hypothetical protein